MNHVLQLSVPVVLASQSPRRQALLDRLEVSYTIHVSPVDESIEKPGPPSAVVQTLADRKVQAVAPEYPSALVLAADTVVAYSDQILNKPESERQARRMLQRLSGSTHSVYTGIALAHSSSNRSFTAVECTDVVFGELSEAEVDAYVASGSPMDKAGAYGIQDHTGALFVDRIEGDYYNVVGLPLRRLYKTIRKHFDDLATLPAA